MPDLLYPLAHYGQESAHLLDYHPESQLLVHMSPASYLRYCSTRYTRPDWDDFVEHLHQSLKFPAMIALKARFLAAQPVDALFLDADPLTGTVITQEGQHRAYLAQELGIALVPVFIYARIRGIGLVDESEIPDFRARLSALFDEAPSLSEQVNVGLVAERTARLGLESDTPTF